MTVKVEALDERCLAAAVAPLARATADNRIAKCLTELL